jgi:hypothetical protein
MAKRDKFYSQTPVAPAKKIAETNPFGGPGIGAGKPATVPKTPGTMSTGLGSEPKHTFRHHLRPHRQKGHLRLSGHPGAHMVGNVKGVVPLPKEPHPARVKTQKKKP